MCLIECMYETECSELLMRLQVLLTESSEAWCIHPACTTWYPDIMLLHPPSVIDFCRQTRNVDEMLKFSIYSHRKNAAVRGQAK